MITPAPASSLGPSSSPPAIGRRRRVAFVVVAVGLLAACGGDQPAASGERPTVPPTASPAPVAPSTVLPGSATTAPAVTAPAVPTTAPATTTISPPITAPPPTVPALAPEPVAIASLAIGLLSPLQHVGLQADDGGIEVPDFEVAGWYRFGGRPGAAGPTVFVGHVDSRDGPAVFYRLRDLAPGDIVEVGLADGTTARYAVTGTEQFPKAEFPTFAVFGATDEDVIRLVTCTGEFNRERRSYYDNLVVTASRVP